MKSTIVFDLDGTLFRNNGEELCFHMENEALAAIGQPPMNRLDHIATWGQTISEALRVRAPHADLDAFLFALADVLTDYALRGEIDVISDDDLDTLYALKARGYRLMVLTNRGFHEVRHLFDLSHPLLDLVGPSCFYHVDNIPRPKPDPVAFQPLLDQHGLTPGECVYVGDSRVDVLAAVGAGMDFVGCLNGDPKHLKRFEGFEVVAVNKISDVLALFPGQSLDWRPVSASNHEVDTNGTEFRKAALPTNFAAAADLRTEERAWRALGVRSS